MDLDGAKAEKFVFTFPLAPLHTAQRIQTLHFDDDDDDDDFCNASSPLCTTQLRFAMS